MELYETMWWRKGGKRYIVDFFEVELREGGREESEYMGN